MNAPITTDALREAWQAMRVRPAFAGWPQTFDQVMADPVSCRLVRLEATGRAHAAATRAPYPACRPARPVFPKAPPPGHFDRKRAAAGERDDD